MQTAVIIIISLLLLILVSVPAWLMWYAAAAMLPSSYSLAVIRMTILSVVLSLITAALMDESSKIHAAEGLMSLLSYSMMWSALLISACVVYQLVRWWKSAKN